MASWLAYQVIDVIRLTREYLGEDTYAPLESLQQLEKIAKRAVADEQSFFSVEKPWIPEFNVFGEYHKLKHPLQSTQAEKKVIGDLADKYVLLRSTTSEPTEAQEKAMYADMAKMISLFLPSLPKADIDLLDRGDRYRLIGACFSAYEEIFQRMAERNSLETPTPDMEAAAAFAAQGVDRAAEPAVS